MSEGNSKSKIKRDVYNFYGMDPPPSGNPEREKLSLQELENHQKRLQSYVAPESHKSHGPENPELSQGNYNERSHRGSQQHNELNLEQNINTNFEKRENPNVEGLQDSIVQNNMVPQRVDDQPDYLQKSQPQAHIHSTHNSQDGGLDFYRQNCKFDRKDPNWAQAQDLFQPEKLNQSQDYGHKGRYYSNLAEAFPLNAYKPTGRHDAHKQLEQDYDANAIRWKYKPTSHYYGNSVPSLY